MAGDLPDGIEQFRGDDPAWWPEDRVTVALREAKRPGIPVLSERAIAEATEMGRRYRERFGPFFK